MPYTQNFHGRIKTAGIDSSESITAPDFVGALSGNADTATAHPATLIPNGTDIDTYVGANYWGRSFYVGGSNTVAGVPEGREGNAFNLEVVRGGGQRTIQVYRDAREELVRYIDAENVSAWRLVAGADGNYPEMAVGEAGRLVMRANVSGAGQLGWYKVGTVTVERLKVIQNANVLSYSLFMLVNGANPPGTNNSAARSGIIEIDTFVGSDGQLQIENGYTAIKVLCGNIDVNDFAVGIDSAGTTLTVYMDARENGVGTRTAFSVISEVYGLMSGSAFEFAWGFFGATAPSGAVFATRTNNASGAEYLSRYAFLSAGDSQMGWWKLGSLNLDEMPNNSNRSCVLLVNGLYANQSQAGAAESGLLEFEVRKGSTSAAGLSILNGNLNAEEFCVVLSQTEATVYIKLPAQYNSFAVTMLSEDSASVSKASPLFEFNTQFIGASVPSGAQYAVVRNIASRAEADSEGNVINETYATLDELSEAEDTMQKGLTAEAAARAAAIENIVEGTTVVGKATADGSGNNIASTYATKTALNSGLAGKASTSGSYPNMSVGSATAADTADGLNLPDAVEYTITKMSNYYLASNLTLMGYGVFLITVGITTNASFGYGDTFSGVVAVDHQASGAGGNTNPFMFSGIIQSPTNPSGEQAILRVRAMSGLGAIMIETLNSSGAVVDPDTILTDTPSLSVRKLIAL